MVLDLLIDQLKKHTLEKGYIHVQCKHIKKARSLNHTMFQTRIYPDSFYLVGHLDQTCMLLHKSFMYPGCK